MRSRTRLTPLAAELTRCDQVPKSIRSRTERLVWDLQCQHVSSGFVKTSKRPRSFMLTTTQAAVLGMTFPFLLESTGTVGAFGVYAGFNLVALVMIFFWVPGASPRPPLCF